MIILTIDAFDMATCWLVHGMWQLNPTNERNMKNTNLSSDTSKTHKSSKKQILKRDFSAHSLSLRVLTLRVKGYRRHHSRVSLLMTALDDMSACLMHNLKELPHARRVSLIKDLLITLCEHSSAKNSSLPALQPLPADNTTLAAPPLRKLLKICLLFSLSPLLQLTRLSTVSTINPAWLFRTHLFRELPIAVLAGAPDLGVRSASPDRWSSRCYGKVLCRAFSFHQQGLDWWRHSSFQVRGH